MSQQVREMMQGQGELYLSISGNTLQKIEIFIGYIQVCALILLVNVQIPWPQVSILDSIALDWDGMGWDGWDGMGGMELE